MANIRLYQFPTKASPVPADIVYVGDSAAAFDEVQCTIAQLISAYPNLSSLAGLTLGLGKIPYSTATAFALLAAGSSGQIFRSGGAGAPTWSTATFPSVATSTGSMLYANGTNWVASTSLWPNTVGSAGKIIRSDGTTNAYTTATYPAVATGTGTILRADGTNWTPTTATFADTYAVSTLLYASGANIVSGLATAQNGVLVSGNTNIPVMLAGPGTTGNILQSNAAAPPSWSTAQYPVTASTANNVIASDGTNFASATLSSIIDAVMGSARGDILYRNATVWTVLAPGTAGFVLKTGGAGADPSWVNVSGVSAVPTVQKFTSGSGNYTTPAGVLYINVIMVGAGGGGAGSGTGAGGNAGATGATSTFGTTLLSCVGGTGGAAGSSQSGGAGGTASLGAAIGTALTGGSGMPNPESNVALVFPTAGAGGANSLGGAGGGGPSNGAGQNGTANTGAGGGGGGMISTGVSGCGGGAGGFVDAIITPTAGQVFAYVVGAGGTAGTAGSGGQAGGTGAAGYIEVREYYQ